MSLNGAVDSAVRKKNKRSVRAHYTDFNTTPNDALSGPMAGLNIDSDVRSPSIGLGLEGVSPFKSPQVGSLSTGPGTSNVSGVHQNGFVAQDLPQPPFNQGQHASTTASSTASPSIPESRYASSLDYTTPIQAEDGSMQLPSFLTFQNVVPPVAGTQFNCIDQGTASARFMRSSMYNVPESEELRSATKLPVSITVRPFAPVLPTEEPIPVVDMSQLGRIEGATTSSGDIGPPRCGRCRTYMNPAVQHQQNGKFTCNICQFGNNTYPPEYYASVDPLSGRRLDASIRPELHKGVYDIIVPQEYNLDDTKATNEILHHVFLIDISENSIKQNLPILLADSIRATLYSDEESPFVGKIALITFDKKINFYNLSENLESTQLSVLSDLEDPFMPFADGLFADVEQSRMVIEDALNHLESLCHMGGGSMPDAEPCFAAACRTAMLCLKSVGNGGKITSVLSALPSWGPGRLKFKDNRSVGRLPNPETEKKIYNPDNEYYRLLAKDFISNNVGLECLVVSDINVDLSNVGWLCSTTGGSVFKWSNFNFERDGRSFTARFYNSVRKSTGYQGQFKVRCSNGLQVVQYYGTSSSALHTSAVGGGPSDPVIPVLNEDQTITVLFNYDGKLETKYDCHFQAAMLYTDPAGIRKVRVINLVLAVSERLEDVFNFVEEDAIVATLLRDTLSFVGKQTFLELRESINTKLVEVFTQYRVMSELGHNRNKTLTNQLLFPDSLKNLPMYILSFLKTRALTQSTEINSDSRLADIFQLLNMPIETLVYRLYPALVELHSLQEHEATPIEPYGFITLPKYKSLSNSSLDEGVYILCDGDVIYVWISPNPNMLLIKDLFGENIESVSEIDPLLDEFPDLPTHISQQARNLVGYFQSQIIGCSSIGQSGIHIVREGKEASTRKFKECLIEDALPGSIGGSSGPGYPEFLSNLHKAIRVKLDNDKSSNNVRQSISSVEHHQDTLAQRIIHY
ncbi:SED5-binding protein 3 [[Candida] anglica]|uniref:SED5-binding protein 3 n=1 Tax=[Candida] anglica TaxID=148631 RepID=A0ABP0E8S3_9ASCO